MSKRILRLLVTLTAIAALGVGGVTLSAATTTRHASGESSIESSAPENSAADPDNVQYTAPGDADYRGTVARQSTRRTAAARHHAHRGRHSGRHSAVQRSARPAQSPPDPDEQSGENESNVESEQGQPGEPVNGHEDPPGQNVNHECTGDCVE
jgi:uncharacterized protein involved in type VI secretion and phage assembly